MREDTFEKVVWPDMKKYEARHFAKDKARREGNETVRKTCG